MKISGNTVLQIDRLFWLPQRIAEFFLNTLGTIKKNQSDKVLIIKFMGLGSIIHLSSLCKRNNIDSSKITLLTLEKNRQLCDMVGFTNTTFIRTTNIFIFSKDCINTILSMRSLTPALIVDYERCSFAVGFFRTLLGLFAQSKTISFENERMLSTEKQLIYPVQHYNQEELFLKGIEFLPRTTNYIPPASKQIESNAYKVLININASNYLLARRYSINNFADLIISLYRWNHALEFYLTGSVEEIPHVATLEKQLSEIPVKNVAGKWSFEQLSEELLTSSLFITCDSGPLHLAVNLGISTIAIWGPTQPEHFGYSSIDHLYNVSLSLSCSPCFKHPSSKPAAACKGKIDCLTSLQPAIIVDKAKEILKHKLSIKSDTQHSMADASVLRKKAKVAVL